MKHTLSKLFRSEQRSRATIAIASAVAGVLGFGLVLFGVFVAR